MNNTNSAIKIGIGVLRFMADVDNMGRSIEKRVEGPVPLCGASRLKAQAIEENLTNLCSAMDKAVRIQSAICSGDAAELDRILDTEHKGACPEISVNSLRDHDSAANALKAVHRTGQQTNLTLLNQMEAFFRSLASEGSWIEGYRTSSVAAKLQELGDTIDREMALIDYFMTDVSDPLVAL